MVRQKKVWRLKAIDEDKLKQLSSELPTSELLLKLFVQRNLSTYEEAKKFINPVLEDLHDPFLMLGMQQAVHRIDIAKNRQESVMIYGDYDVDGTTSVAVVYDFLSQHFSYTTKQSKLTYYIPHRYTEGYGLSFIGIDEAHRLGCTLIITLDCGTKSIDKIAYANSLGIDIIVCDHHTPGTELPEAYALLNPKQDNCPYPFKELSACGIGYKLISALAIHWQLPTEVTHKYLDLVATSIAADIVPLIGENRILAYYGLLKANSQPCLALSALKKLTNFNRDFSISDLVFIVSPRINAAGRMGDAKKAVALFIAQSEAEAAELAAVLQSDNEDRREIDKVTTEEALALLQDEQFTYRKSTVLFQEHWHKGVVGIVASRLIDHYYKPTIILTQSNGKATGSARSVIGFNIHDAIQQCEALLDTFGGHFFAAGLTLPIEKVSKFIEMFEDVVSNTIQQESLQPIIDIDLEINFSDINYNFYRSLQRFQPYGPENMKPIFKTSGVKNNRSKIVKEEHIKFDVIQSNKHMSGIAFNMADKFDILSKPTFDMVYTIEENEWQGEKSLQLRVIDIQ